MRTNIAIGIPTVGRAAILRETIREIARQTRAPDRIIVAATAPADAEGLDPAAARVIFAAPGLPRQRNAVIAEAAGADIVVFFDDDFLPHPDYLAEIERYMDAEPRAMVVTGQVLADGIGGPGLTPAAGRAILAAARPAPREAAPTFGGYGCNMALRLGPVREHGILFDERLPLYGWQEDVDLSLRLGAHGRIVRLSSARGVHLGVKSGRASGRRLGYSQIANPLYLAGKRCGYPLGRALSHMARNVAMNAARAAFPEPYIDRRGRLFGNLHAMRDMLAGRMAPERMLNL